ncbi:poly-beta-1,6-N-acetyl-D-glucosamine synthase [Avibacterium endocarditidis]|uniref:poly-beta-1,6-N-acetyl-D-glucosamine synthase n=1 Tax=Avibacterium endocarditidis TaxID=380674 RepID=UPI003CCB74EF
MAIYWSVSGIIYFIFKEKRGKLTEFSALPTEQIPLVSIMIPCYNESDNLDESIPHLLNLDYPNYELIFINDGSRDNTGEIIDRWATKDSRIIALHQKKNSGKASALNNALTIAKGKYVACIDGDAILDYSSIDYMVQVLENNPKYGAVTGNPRVRNRSTILGRLQVSEFSSIIGLIKRAQSLMGTIFTVSGVCCLFRADLMHQVDGWGTNMITEDIDVSWKLQTAGYDIYYEPRALCWVLMPETLRGLWKQRLRWEQGGAEVIMKYFPVVWRMRNRRLWPMYVEYFVTAIWAIFLVITTFLSILTFFMDVHISQWINVSIFKSSITILFSTFFLQCLFSLYIDSRYEKGLIRYVFPCIWYPWAYWLLNNTINRYSQSTFS